MLFGSALAAATLLVAIFIANAPRAQAFSLWPFSVAQADTIQGVPRADTSALTAATNIDPNPNKNRAVVAIAEGSALIANQGPEGIPSGDSVFSPTNTQISTYIVQSGDTLSEIAQNFGVSVNTIIWANDLGSSKAIHTGQTLVILPVSGIEHTVLKGETLASIAKKYVGNAADIANFNGLDASAPLIVGSQVIIPGGQLVGTTPVTTKPKPGRVGTKNLYRGGSGNEVDDYYASPVAGGLLTQGLHGENGVDIAAPRGTLATAAADGVVIYARNNGAWNGGYGNYVVIAHDNGTQTLYSHFITGSVTVSIGDQVAQGQVIGKVGATGDATGPHVHFEVRGALNLFALCPLHTAVPEFGCAE